MFTKLRMYASLVYFVLCFLLSFTAVASSSDGAFQSVIRRDLSRTQWTYLLRQLKIWNGFWTRYDASGTAFQTSRVQRNFTKLNDDTWLQTNTYDNPEWQSNGETVLKFLYLNTTPLPRYAVRLYPNGTLGDEAFPASYIAFYPRQWGLLGSRALTDVGVFVLEKYFPHPVHTLSRFSIIPVYVGGRFQLLVLAREVSDPASYPQRRLGFTLDTRANVITQKGTQFTLAGVWARVEECIMLPFKYSKRFSFIKDAMVPFHVAPYRITLRLPNSISVSYPRTLNATKRRAFTVFHTVWNVDARTVVAGRTMYRKDGSLARDCTTTYYKIE